MSETASKMPAALRIGAVGGPTTYYRTDIVERMADEFAATNRFLSLLSDGLDLDEDYTAVTFTFRDKITGEVIRREEVTLKTILKRAAAALNSYREASNDES